MKQKTRKPLGELNLLNRFLFGEVMEDSETYQSVLEIILGHEVNLRDNTQSEKEIRTLPTFRGIRLDVWGQEEDGTIYNSEMQAFNTRNLPRRSRYYQSVLDAGLLEPGTIDFNHLANVYLITIAPFDLFGKRLCRYTFKMRCEEDDSLRLEDGAVRIFLNTRGEGDDRISPELMAFLRYVEHSTKENAAAVDSLRLRKLHDRVQSVKGNEGIEVKYMQLWEEKAMERLEGRKEGRKEGRQEGEEYFAALTERLLKDSRTEDLIMATSDKGFREVLYKEYGIKNQI